MPMEGQPGGHQGEGGWSAVEPMRRSAKQLWSGALKSVQTMGGVARQVGGGGRDALAYILTSGYADSC
jgi:hypothetical protein